MARSGGRWQTPILQRTACPQVQKLAALNQQLDDEELAKELRAFAQKRAAVNEFNPKAAASDRPNPEAPPSSPPPPAAAPVPPPEASESSGVPTGIEASPATASEPSAQKLSASVTWCCNRARELKDDRTINSKAALGRRLAKDLGVAVDRDDTDVLRPLKAHYIENHVEEWGIWPLHAIE